MAATNHLLKKYKKYYFCVFFAVDLKTIESLKCEYLKVKWVKLFSKEFEDLAAQIVDFYMFEEDFRLYKYYHAEEISCLFYSENEENIDTFYDFLILLQPSRIRRWMTFNTTYSNHFTESAKKYAHQTGGGYALWTNTTSLNDEYMEGDLCYIAKRDFPFVNELLRKYSKLGEKKFFKEFFALYQRAYSEDTDYFQYLLYFMIIESFIKDDETTGVVYKIRRLCAVLVGESKEECEMIYKKTRDAYQVRSHFVHQAKVTLRDAKYLPYIKSIVCELGILILISDLTADNIFSTCNHLGYGQKQTLITATTLKKHGLLFMNWLNILSLEKPKKNNKQN